MHHLVQKISKFREKLRYWLVFRDFGPREGGVQIDPRLKICVTTRFQVKRTEPRHVSGGFPENKYVGEKHRSSKIDLPLFIELGQTSRDLGDMGSETKESWDVCPNSTKSGKSILPFWVWLTYFYFKKHIYIILKKKIYIYIYVYI